MKAGRGASDCPCLAQSTDAAPLESWDRSSKVAHGWGAIVKHCESEEGIGFSRVTLGNKRLRAVDVYFLLF